MQGGVGRGWSSPPVCQKNEKVSVTFSEASMIRKSIRVPPPTHPSLIPVCDFSGIPVIESLQYDSSTGVLTCTSTGGPVTEVLWERDGMPETRFQGSKVITNTVSAAYTNTLLLNGEPEAVVGNYSCSVSNSRGSSVLASELRGK